MCDRDFAPKQAFASVMHMQSADLAGDTATLLGEPGIGKRRLVLLERGQMASEERSALLFARPGSVELLDRQYLSVGGEHGSHNHLLPSGAF